MAIKMERDKNGKMQVTKRTGMDALSFKFGSALEKIKSIATKPIKKQQAYNARKELDNVTRAFGSVENYTRMYPDYSKRAAKLKKRAYDN